jgi:nucleotide-binding universal stress UspA family protein
MGFELGTDGPLVIVVGVDGSDSSIRAGAYAAGLARRQGSELVVVYIQTTPAVTSWAPGVAGAIAEGRPEELRLLEQQVKDGAAHVGVPARFVTAAGDPFTELSRIATEERADALVVGASASAGHRFVGSLAVRMVKAGRWPVTVVP